MRRLGEVQIDPTSAVARTEQLVLFSRLGRRFRVAELERLLWGERALFEYWAHIVPTADLPIHRISMRRYPHGTWKRREYVRRWLEANDAFVRYVIGELRRRGPLRARDLENRAAEGWQTGGWNDEGQNVPMLLDILWLQGRVMIVGRDGQQRIWDLASRSLPRVPARPASEIATELVDRQLRARGLERLERIGIALRRAGSDAGDRDPSPPARRADRADRGRGPPGSVGRAPRSVGHDVPWPHDAAFALRRPDLGPGAYRAPVRLPVPVGDLRAEGEARVRVFRPPDPPRRPTDRADRPALRPEGGRASRERDLHASQVATPSDWPPAKRAIDELAAWLGANEVVWPALPAVWR